jgi:hypothetical protein
VEDEEIILLAFESYIPLLKSITRRRRSSHTLSQPYRVGSGCPPAKLVEPLRSDSASALLINWHPHGLCHVILGGGGADLDTTLFSH